MSGSWDSLLTRARVRCRADRALAESSIPSTQRTLTYTYVWKTNKSWNGKCGTLTLIAGDSLHTAKFQLK
jgi:hypothetical protein